MDYSKVTSIATCFIALSTSLGVLAAIVYYLYQIKNTTIFEALVVTIIYIDINLYFYII